MYWVLYTIPMANKTKQLRNVNYGDVILWDGYPAKVLSNRLTANPRFYGWFDIRVMHLTENREYSTTAPSDREYSMA